MKAIEFVSFAPKPGKYQLGLIAKINSRTAEEKEAARLATIASFGVITPEALRKGKSYANYDNNESCGQRYK